MSKLLVNNLIFSGVHGSTGREPHDLQRFAVELEIEVDTEAAEVSDRITDTYDYKDARAIARQVIERERYVLIETIASRIAERICDAPKVQSAHVTLRKLDASNNGIPAISIFKKRAPQERGDGLLDFDITRVLEDLKLRGGASVTILSEPYRKKLLAEAESYTYERQPEVVGPNKVREELSSVTDFPPQSLFWRLKKDFEETFLRKLRSVNVTPFDRPLAFNEMSLQLYEKGSHGIDPHQDYSKMKNIICVFVLKGKGRTALCEDRARTKPYNLDGTPGNVILLVGPGFMGSNFRPIHFLSDIEEDRIVLGLRQKVCKPQK